MTLTHRTALAQAMTIVGLPNFLFAPADMAIFHFGMSVFMQSSILSRGMFCTFIIQRGVNESSDDSRDESLWERMSDFIK